jgi:membrane protein DedA with SNARE-associated domain
LGGILWATIYGIGSYLLGNNINRITGPVGIAFVVIAVLLLIAGFIFLRRNIDRLMDEAEKALPGPLDTSKS